MKVLLVAQNLYTGGVQRSFVNFCKALSENYPEYSIDVFTLCGGGLMQDIPDSIDVTIAGKGLNILLTAIRDVKEEYGVLGLITRYVLSLSAKLIGTERLYRCLFKMQRNKKQNYDVAVSYFTDIEGGISNKGTNWYVADYVNAKRKIAWIHTDPEKAKFNRESCLKKYRTFDKIACVSYAVKDKLDNLLPEYSDKTTVVYNVFPVEEILKKSIEAIPKFDSNTFNIVSVGRIDNATKRMDRMIKVCDMLKKKGVRNFKWRIIGNGPDYESNLKMAQDMQVMDVLSFEGHKDNPYPWIKNSDLFVLTSHYEGYPMVLGESIILGVPVVTTNFAAAREMISENNGIITGMSEEEIFDAVYGLINDSGKYQKLKNKCDGDFVNKDWKAQINEIL